MNTLKLDVFLRPTRKIELAGKKYDVHPVSLRERVSFVQSDKGDEDVEKFILDHIPDLSKDQLYDLPPLALHALLRFCLQIEDEPEKN